ncbi:hypothetical protein VoSk93_49520 [Vibrio owensii]
MKKSFSKILVMLGCFEPVRDVYRFIQFYSIKFINYINPFEVPCDLGNKRCAERILSGHYKYHIIGGNTPKCCATNLLNILRDVTKVLEDNKIRYFINYGTFLGSVRHKGIIPWDTDIDIGILKSDLDKVYEALVANCPNNYLIKMSGGFLRVYLSKNNSLHLDFDIWHEEGEVITMYHDLQHGSLSCKMEDVFPTKKYEFYDLYLQGPKKLTMLEQSYGDEYKTVAYKKWGYKAIKKYKLIDFSPAELNESGK